MKDTIYNPYTYNSVISESLEKVAPSIITSRSNNEEKIINGEVSFGASLKCLPSEGNLVYEYNPLHNYQINSKRYFYKGKVWSLKELADYLGIPEITLDGKIIKEKPDVNWATWGFAICGEKIYKTHGRTLIEAADWNTKYDGETWSDSFFNKFLQYDQLEKTSISISNVEEPILIEPGQLSDFDTAELEFDLEHPVDITPQYSYDNTVNLIINDGKNDPKLINTRFSPIGKDRYLIIDRIGNFDTNIYREGTNFPIDVSLYKKTTKIPKLEFIGVRSGGEMPIGNYHFYFTYLDADNNETDIIAESGLVSLFVGDSPDSCRQGFRNENSHKLVKFRLTNLDTSYPYVRIYYSLATSDINENETVSIYKINNNFPISAHTIITITGFEDRLQVTDTDINPLYLAVKSAETLALCQNMLFLGNVLLPELLYSDLTDIALHFVPSVYVEDFAGDISPTYLGSHYGYCDPEYIYNRLGYENGEIYKFGIVFIMPNNTLSPVFNIRGTLNLTLAIPQKIESIYDNNGIRKMYEVSEDFSFKDSYENIYNSKGVVRFNYDSSGATKHLVYGVKMHTSKEVLTYLRDVLLIKGYFFVRLKRIPLKLCLAYTIGIDKLSCTPVLPYELNNIRRYVSESFITKNGDKVSHKGGGGNSVILAHEENNRKVDNAFRDRIRYLEEAYVRKEGAICPDYDINSPYLNSLFTGSEFPVRKAEFGPAKLYLTSDDRHFYINKLESHKDTKYSICKIVGILDNTKLASIGDKYFAGRAGEAEEAFKFEYLGKENKTTEADNLIRGAYGPYLAITGYKNAGELIDIYIPGFSESLMIEYFKLRYQDSSSYYATSDRYSLNDLDELIDFPENGELLTTIPFKDIVFRGDTYICLFTHRFNRNFKDPSAPINDVIVDSKTWVDNYELKDGVLDTEKSAKINLGDLNAVLMGMWVTFWLRSYHNLNVRALDNSDPSEEILTGHARGFYPYYPMSTKGSYKLPEALCYNKGYDRVMSDRWNFTLPAAPYYKEEFSNRIIYSNPYIIDSFENGIRVFKLTHVKDYDKTYGLIVRLIELDGDLVCVFEHGIGVLTVNERALASEGTGGNVYINTNNVLPKTPHVISDTYGSQWKDSIIKTPKCIYGVDTVAKKIWRCTKSQFEIISDFKILKFLIDNISLTEREKTPYIGIRNVKTFYNANKGDVMFTFYDNLEGITEKVWNVCYNEVLNIWTTFYSWLPSAGENIHNSFFSFDRNTSKWIARLSQNPSDVNYIIDSPNWETPFNYELLKDPWGNKNKFILENSVLKLAEGVTVKSFSDTVIYLYAKETKGLANFKEHIIALIWKENLDKLTTDFWKHGLAGIIDIKDDVKPAYWYGKLHPFEFEFVVNDHPDVHKIFDNLLIISNKACPESFHYEIVGDCYEFAKDKKNMYIRQEATKDFFQANGVDIEFNKDYKGLKEELRPYDGNESSKYYDKSTLFPLYYRRDKHINEIESSYNLIIANNSNYSALTGSEIVYKKDLDEFRIWTHAKGVSLTDDGRLRGNMHYREDCWYVLINPINFVLKNEEKWENEKVPIELRLSLHFDKYPERYNPNESSRGYTAWSDCKQQEAKIKDKFIKIRVRYSGELLAIISALKTLYSISYS